MIGRMMVVIGASVLAIALLGAAGAGMLFPLRRTASPAVPPRPGTLPVAEVREQLHRLILSRFQTVETSQFGVNRLLTLEELEHRTHPRMVTWKPEPGPEKSVVAKLEADGWSSVLFVSGRAALQPKPQFSSQRSTSRSDRERELHEAMERSYDRRILTPGIVLAGNPHPGSLPSRELLLPEMKRAFIAFGKGDDSITFRSGNWSFVGRAVRAEKAECLSCHKTPDTPLRVGDVLAVAVYGFGPNPAVANARL